MADEDPLVRTALDEINRLTREIIENKIFINKIDKFSGREPRFSDDELAGVGSAASSGPARMKKWQPGDFFNKPFAGAVRMYLLARADAAGGPSPASVDEIHEALMEGSFKFDTSGPEPQKNSIRISLGKNSPVFVRLPNTDQFGLVEWYGAAGRKPGRKSAASKAAQSTTNPDDASGEEATSSDNHDSTEGKE